MYFVPEKNEKHAINNLQENIKQENVSRLLSGNYFSDIIRIVSSRRPLKYY